MRLPRTRVLVALLAVAGTAALVPLATAAPTCTGPTPPAACGGRVVAEPLLSATFVQYGSEIFPVLDAIEAIAPEVVEVYTLSELTGNPDHVSAGGRELPVVRLTDESEPGAGKKKAVLSLSVHGNESAGREGGVRYIEDVARWWVDDREREVFSGDRSYPLAEVLAGVEVWLGFTNVDGWAAGDLGVGGTTFSRGNGNGVDLNRQFPTMGWPHPAQTPLSEPESDGWAEFVLGLGPIATASDIHGEVTSANNAFADLMWPADQWTPDEQARELSIGVNVARTIERKFDEYGVVLGELTGASGTMKPAVPATGYDVVGYDDAGFMGDWLTQATGAIDIDAENFLSHIVPGNVWVGPLEQAHVAAVRGIVEAVMVEAMFSHTITADLDLGRVAYVLDPDHVTAPAVAGVGEERPRVAVDSWRMRYFEDLADAAGVPVVPVSSGDVATADLSSYDSLVLADVAIPRDPAGRPVDDEAYVAALERFVAGGGQLVLTDGAIGLLERLGFGDENALQEAQFNAGHLDFGERTHAWEEQLQPTASQTYYEVPLGFSPQSSAPHFGVATSAWEEAGGTTVATVGEGQQAFTALGELPRGSGRISIFGAVLPTADVESDPEDGLADYAVSIAGGQVLHSILSYRRAGAGPAPQPSPRPVPQPRPEPPAPLPATGTDGVLPVLAAAVVAAALGLRRRPAPARPRRA
jgi:hypothetical protein